MGTDRDPSDAAGGPEADGPGNESRNDDAPDDAVSHEPHDDDRDADRTDEPTDAVPTDTGEAAELEVVAVESLDEDAATTRDDTGAATTRDDPKAGPGDSRGGQPPKRDDELTGHRNPAGSERTPRRSDARDGLASPGSPHGHTGPREDDRSDDDAFATDRTDTGGWRRWAELGDDTVQGSRQDSHGRWHATEQAGSRHERLFAGLLSFFLPGVGHVVAGQSKRGAAVLAGTLIWLAFHWFVLVPFFAVVLGGMTVFLLGIGALLAPVFGAGTQFVVHVLAGLDAHRQVREMR